MLDALRSAQLSNSSSATSGSGDADGSSSTGNRVFNFGVNPAAGTDWSNPYLIAGVVVFVVAVAVVVVRR